MLMEIVKTNFPYLAVDHWTVSIKCLNNFTVSSATI